MVAADIQPVLSNVREKLKKVIKPGKVLAVPLYPFLIALAPVVNLYAQNYLALNLADLIRPAVICLLIAAVSVLVSRIVSGTNRRAALLGGVLVLSVMAYGFVYFLVHQAAGIQIPGQVFLAAWLILTAVIYGLLIVFFRRMRGSLRDITIVFNVFSLVIVLAAIIPVLLAKTGEPDPTIAAEQSPRTEHEWLESGDIEIDRAELPDVYFIVLDAYARGDVLETRFSYDNSRFLGWLESKGFFIGDKSHSNYPWTHLSLTSTFNSEYLDTLVPEMINFFAPNEDSIRFLYFKAMLIDGYVQTGRVPRFFSELGYRIISNDTGYSLISSGQDTLAARLFGPVGQLEEGLIGQTLVQPLMPVLRKISAVRQLEISDYDRVVGSLADLESAADEPGPKFVFHHIVSPHEPFCFDEKGERTEPHPLYDSSQLINDKVSMPGYREWFTETYPVNLAGFNRHLETTFRKIMDSSGGNAVIIVQSDHGSHAGFDPGSPENSDIVERFGILNAVYLPPGLPRHGLERTMSSVNTFRVVFNNLFGLELPLLEDRAFFSDGDLDFQEVTENLVTD
jgi:hypothetical protein